MTRLTTQKAFEQKVHNKTNGEIICLDPYKGTKNKHRWKHLTCGEVFPATPDRIYNRVHPCPKCHRMGYIYHTDQGRVNHLVEVRCPKKHRYQINKIKLRNYYLGKIECPICKKTKIWDPIYEDAVVDFSFERQFGMRGGPLC